MPERRRIVIVGGGSAGITVAARLRRAGEDDVTIIEPSATHYYQPLWTLVGAGVATVSETARPMARVIPRGVSWVRDRAVDIDPEARVVVTGRGDRLHYDALVVAPGIQLDWGGIPGLEEAITYPQVSSNYRVDLAPRTWEHVNAFRGGTALFTGIAGPHKCGGAAQKAAYLSADAFRRNGVLVSTDVVFATPTPTIFGVPEFARPLEAVVARYGIDTRFRHELVELRPAAREAVFVVEQEDGTRTRETITYDLLHLVPPQSAPDFLKGGPLAVAGDARGFVDVDAETLQHRRYADVFALGDASGAPNAKTGAAVRKQAPVVTANVRAVLDGRPLTERYDGYSSCPIVTGYGKLVLAEFDYSGRPHPTIPFIDTARERTDLYYLKRYGLPLLYWYGMLKGIA
jgi:sulfide:quinone oxidoreductase